MCGRSMCKKPMKLSTSDFFALVYNIDIDIDSRYKDKERNIFFLYFINEHIKIIKIDKTV